MNSDTVILGSNMLKYSYLVILIRTKIWRLKIEVMRVNFCFTHIRISFFLKFFFVCPIRLPVFSFFSIIEWTRIGYFNRPGMVLTPFPSSTYRMRQDLNPRPFDRESSLLSTRPGFRPSYWILYSLPTSK